MIFVSFEQKNSVNSKRTLWRISAAQSVRLPATGIVKTIRVNDVTVERLDENEDLKSETPKPNF